MDKAWIMHEIEIEIYRLFRTPLEQFSWGMPVKVSTFLTM